MNGKACWAMVLCLAGGIVAPAQTVVETSRVLERDRNLEIVEVSRSVAGKTVTNRFTRMANGLHHRDASGNWVKSQPQLASYPDGIVGTGSGHRVILATNLNTSGSVDFQSHDGSRVVSHPLAILYFDPESGRSVTVGTIQDSAPELAPPNQVVYRDAFAGDVGNVSVVYTYGKGSWHQDVVFEAQVPSPGAYNLGPQTRIEIISEILQSPEPTKTIHLIREETDPVKRAQMVEPDVVDETLSFGAARMTLGWAYPSGERSARTRVAVTKRLMTVDQRRVLVESVEWRAVNAVLEKLPARRASAGGTTRQAGTGRQLPVIAGNYDTSASSMLAAADERLEPLDRSSRRESALTSSERRWSGLTSAATESVEKEGGAAETVSFETRLAQITGSSEALLAANTPRSALPAGLVMDYETLDSYSDGFTFENGTTYLVESSGAYAENPIFESGAIIKYEPEASLTVSGEITAPQGSESLILTSEDDDSVGADIDGVPDSIPDSRNAEYALAFYYVPSMYFGYLDVRFAQTAVYCYGGSWVLYGQFLDCDLGVFAASSTISLSGDMCLVDSWYDESGGSVSDDLTSCTADRDADGLPDGWEVTHFGTLTESDTEDYDGDGVNNEDEYSMGTDPNTIAFTVNTTNNYVRTSTTLVELDVTGGVPAGVAVLVGSTNYAGASWSAYTSSNVIVNLDSAEGWQEVWIGLRGRQTTSEQTWQWKRFNHDATPPLLVVTSPASTITQPMIQVQGYSPEPLLALSCDITNAAGLVTNLMALVLDQHYDTNTFAFTTNAFQVFDVDLTNGLNTITLSATDLAGNTTTTNYDFILESDEVAPGLTLHWPLDGMKLCGNDFTVRGVVDDYTAAVTLMLADTNSVTNTFSGLVERNGNFWLEDLPLAEGTNYLELTATDAWENSTTTNFTVTRSAVTLTFDPINESQLHQPTITLTGTVDGGYDVTVNGVAADVNGGYWAAADVPVNAGGTASFAASASASGQNAGNADVNVDKPPRLYVASSVVAHQDTEESGEWEYLDEEFDPTGLWGWWNEKDQYSHYWKDNAGASGCRSEFSEYENHEDYGSYGPCLTEITWLPSLWENVSQMYGATVTTCEGFDPTYGSESPLELDEWNWEHCAVVNPPPREDDILEWSYVYYAWYHATWHRSYTRHAQTTIKFFTGGKARSKEKNLYVVTGGAMEVLNKRALPPYIPTPPGVSIPSQRITIGELGDLDSTGVLLVLLPDNVTKDITPSVRGTDFYIFGVNANRRCACSCSTTLTEAEWMALLRDYPRLIRCHVCKLGGWTDTYNCLAWTIGDTTRPWWLEADANSDLVLSDSELDAFYAAKGIASGTISYYGPSSNDIKHVAKKSGGSGEDCQATSKLGITELIAHDITELEGGVYGNVVGGN